MLIHISIDHIRIAEPRQQYSNTRKPLISISTIIQIVILLALNIPHRTKTYDWHNHNQRGVENQSSNLMFPSTNKFQYYRTSLTITI